MKKTLLLLFVLSLSLPIMAETKKYDFDFYGFLRTDFFYNSRASAESCNELFYLFPLDEDINSVGEDLNATSTSGIYSFVTRMGVKMKGPDVGKATATGQIEVDFAGYGDMTTLLRIRQAYLNLNWESGSSLLLGQTWHPLFGSYLPSMVNLSTGAPFQPFNRSPQVRYTYQNSGFKFLAAAMCQLQYTTWGPNGMSIEYQVNGKIPEFYGGADYITKSGWTFGVGADASTISPRTESIVGGETYKVDEMLTSISGEAHIYYQGEGMWKFGMKSLYASALDHTLMLGGYGVTSISGYNDEQTYTPLHQSTTWVNVTYGKTWMPKLFVGYTKNLGSTESLVSTDKIYGWGTDIDQLLGVNLCMSYNQPHWMFAVEYSTSTAWYGDINLSNGRVENTHDVTNNRITAIMAYLF